MWDKLVTSQEGQNQFTGWAEIATCATRSTYLVYEYNDQAATADTGNRCRARESAEGLMKDKHARMAASWPATGS